jgi:tetratricopeptide (TPR) repeat protein
MAWRWIWAPLLAASLAACSPLSWTSRNEGTPPSWGQVELGLSDQERALGEFLKGEVALRNGDTGFAIVSYENAARLEPDEPRLHGRLAHLYVRRGDLERALPHAQAAVAGNPDDDFSRTLLAGALAGLGRDKEAADHYREIIRRTPDQSDPYLLLASLHSKDGDDPAARATLEALLKTAPNSVMGRYYLGRLHATAGRLDEADEEFREALRRNPRSTLVLTDLGLIEEMRGEPARAAVLYRRVLALAPENSTARERLASVLIGQKKFNEALTHFRALERIEADPTGTRVKIALIFLEQGDYDRAATELELVARAAPDDPDVHYYLGITYSETNAFDRAESHLKKVRSGTELYADSQLQLAYLKQRQGQLSAAGRHATLAVEARPDSPDLVAFLIAIERERGNLTHAVALARTLAKDYPENDRYRFTLGALLDESGDRQASIAAMRKAISLNPRNSEALNYLGYTFAEEGRNLDEAERLILRALAIDPSDGFYMDSLGWVYFQQRRYGRAVEKLERAVELTGNDVTIQEHLGDAYRQMGRESEARRLYQDAQEGTASNEQRRRIEHKLRRDGHAKPPGKRRL